MGACSGCQRRPIRGEHNKQKIDEALVFNKRRCRMKGNQPSRNNVDERAPMLSRDMLDRPQFSSDHKSSTPKYNVNTEKSFMPSRRKEKMIFYTDSHILPGQQQFLGSHPLTNSRISSRSSDEDPALPRSTEDDVESGFYDGNNDHQHSCSSHGSTSPGSDRANTISNQKLKQIMPTDTNHGYQGDQRRENYLVYHWPQHNTARQSLHEIKNANRLSADPSHLLPSSCLLPSCPPLCNWVEDTSVIRLSSFDELIFSHATGDIKAFVNTRLCKHCDVIAESGGSDTGFSTFVVFDEKTSEWLSASRMFIQFQEFVIAKFTLETVNGLFCREMQCLSLINKRKFKDMCRFVSRDNTGQATSILDYPFRHNVETLKLITAGQIDATVDVVETYVM